MLLYVEGDELLQIDQNQVYTSFSANSYMEQKRVGDSCMLFVSMHYRLHLF